MHHHVCRICCQAIIDRFFFCKIYSHFLFFSIFLIRKSCPQKPLRHWVKDIYQTFRTTHENRKASPPKNLITSSLLFTSNKMKTTVTCCQYHLVGHNPNCRS